VSRLGRPLQVDQQHRLSIEEQQAFITWGDRAQTNILASEVTPGKDYAFPVPAGASSIIQPLPRFKRLDQMVDVKFARPTTWTINLYAECLQQMNVGDSFSVTWSVRTSVGQATNELLFITNFVEPSTGGLQRIIVAEQLAAMTIQVIPTQVVMGFALAQPAHDQNIVWSAWAAPLVD